MESSNMKKEVIESLKDYLGRIIPGIEEIILLFRTGKEAEALKSMEEVIEGLQWIYDAATLTQDVQVTKLETAVMSPFLVEMVGALENMDYVLLCDLLEYEILPILNEWNNQL